MKKISEISLDFSVINEYNNLHELFCDVKVFARGLGGITAMTTRPCLSLCGYFEERFLGWKLRGTFVNPLSMMKALGIDRESFCESATEDRLLEYIQFVINAVCYVKKSIQKEKLIFETDRGETYKAIWDNCNRILEMMSAQVCEDEGEYYVRYTNRVADSVARNDEVVSNYVNEFFRVDINGNLYRKQEILCILSNALESNKQKLKSGGFKKLYDEASFLLNNAGIRHPFRLDRAIEKYFSELDVDELERYYNYTFDMIIANMAMLPYLDGKDEIDRIRKMK